MPEINITVHGNPIAKKRPRFVRRGKFIGTYNCQETEEGKFAILAKTQLNGAQPIEASIGIDLTIGFYMPIPASWTKKRRAEHNAVEIPHVKKPDVDNLVKFVKDCLNGIAWHDDSQVTAIRAFKSYDGNPRTEITIYYDDLKEFE